MQRPLSTILTPLIVVALSALVGLTGCERKASGSIESPAESPTAKSAVATPAASPATRLLATDNAFSVKVSLSPSATQRLSQGKETIIVSADYFGNPTPAAQQQNLLPEAAPWLTLLRQQKEIDSAGSVRFDAVALDAAKLGMIDRREPQLLINVYSGRKSSPDNLLSCDTFQDPLQKAIAGITIHCTLIGE